MGLTSRECLSNLNVNVLMFFSFILCVIFWRFFTNLIHFFQPNKVAYSNWLQAVRNNKTVCSLYCVYPSLTHFLRQNIVLNHSYNIKQWQLWLFAHCTHFPQGLHSLPMVICLPASSYLRCVYFLLRLFGLYVQMVNYRNVSQIYDQSTLGVFCVLGVYYLDCTRMNNVHSIIAVKGTGLCLLKWGHKSSLPLEKLYTCWFV